MQIKPLSNLIGLLIITASASSAAAPLMIQATAVEVEDGDTIIIPINGKAEHVQLLGIDAPEDKENPKLLMDIKRTGLQREALIPLGQAATEHLTSLIKASGVIAIELEGAQKDRYGRLNLVVKDSKGGSLNQSMVEDGYAISLMTSDQEQTKALANLQTTARAKHRGLWSHAATASWVDQ
jgi:endonuclease YncB( thermonuclease family)